MICEPFVLRCGAVNDKWFPEFDQYRSIAKKLAIENKAVFVPFQSMFDEAVKYAEPKHWAGDGGTQVPMEPLPNGSFFGSKQSNLYRSDSSDKLFNSFFLINEFYLS